MSKDNYDTIVTPTGRFVQGNLYTPNTKDAEGKPLVYKTGDKAGQARSDYYIAIAIKKMGETHWANTDWGKKIWAIGHKGFPNGAANSPTFAWKITDGDSTVPNRKGTVPANCDGFAGCWILKFNGSIAPQLVGLDDKSKTFQMPEKDAIKPGDYIQISGNIVDNGSSQQPGIHLNHNIVCFRAFGPRIFLGVDPDAVGFGGDALPVGASATPLGDFNPPAQGTQQPPMPPMAAPAPIPPISTMPAGHQPPAPHTGILNPAQPPAPPMTPPPAVAASVRRMTAKAQGTYEDYIKAGWNDTQLLQHGMMEP